jgi:hypothetical protein
MEGVFMFSPIFMAAWLCVFFVGWSWPWDQPPGQSYFLWRIDMSTDKEVPAVAKRETQAETRPTKVRVSEFVLYPERFSHRDEAEFKKARLKPHMDSLVSEGMQVPVEFYRDKDGKPVLLKGHRRIFALRALADDNLPGFSRGMEVDALEVVNATAEDRLLRSVLDNVNRATLSIPERMRAGKVLYDNGIDSARAAFALGISPKQYERDLRIARAGWMMAYIEEDSISASHASRLLEEAEKAGRLTELKEDLDYWIAAKKRLIREHERLRKVVAGKDLKPALKVVKTYLGRELVDHWVDLLKRKKRFDEEVEWNFAAGIEKETGELRIESLTLDLKNDPLEDVAKVVARLGKLTQEILPILESRNRDEGDGPQARVREDKEPYDLDLLRKHGLNALAEKLEADLKAEEEAAQEEQAAEQGQEPQEEDAPQ